MHFFKGNVWIPLKYQWYLLLMSIDHMSTLVQLTAWPEQVPSYYWNPWWSSSMTYICAKRPHWLDDFILWDNPLIKKKKISQESREWAVPTRRVGSVRWTGWPYFAKSPLWCKSLTQSTFNGGKPSVAALIITKKICFFSKCLVIN